MNISKSIRTIEEEGKKMMDSLALIGHEVEGLKAIFYEEVIPITVTQGRGKRGRYKRRIGSVYPGEEMYKIAQERIELMKPKMTLSHIARRAGISHGYVTSIIPKGEGPVNEKILSRLIQFSDSYLKAERVSSGAL